MVLFDFGHLKGHFLAAQIYSTYQIIHKRLGKVKQPNIYWDPSKINIKFFFKISIFMITFNLLSCENIFIYLPLTL